MGSVGMNLSVLPGATGHVRLVESAMPVPPIGADVLVRMVRAPINPADLLAMDGRYSFDLSHDVPLGAEGAAMVAAVGEAVTDIAPGDMVLPLSRGNWCRYRTVRRSDLIALPHGIDMAQAAMLRINPPTARLLLQATGAAPGDVIVQNAAASAVATWVRAMAARMDVTVIDVVRRPDDALRDAIVDGQDLADRVKAAAAGRPVRAALDCVAGAATGRMAQCLAPGGRLIVFGHLSGEPISVRSQLLTGGGLSISGFSLRPTEAAMGAEAIRAMFAELLVLHAETRPILPVRDVIPLSQADAAIALARCGGQGRVLFDLTG
ncbi:alcohol dehydrogenase catalytic domain-containing protein [Sphingobium sp.]|uniref:alcohol dehydrogenase catalytic domain-containing protein n=1 Tax=Sphingobium sp. TaxID=1912891 RepID=UPI0028BD9612|nr:zinc-binding dehydrogenase [Sphingobium sp.]